MTDYIPLTFGLEALYPPMALPSTALRDLYNRLAEPCRFTEFRQLGEGQGARLAEGNNRHLTLTNDRFIYRDEYTQRLFSTFCEDVQQLLASLREILHIPVLLHNKVLVRLLMPHRGQETTVDYFQRTMVGQASQHFNFFKRPISGMGFRLVFPPNQQMRSTFQIRIEPYYRDLKMFFLENSAQFFDPLVDLNGASQYLEEAYNFLKEQAGPFLLSLSSGDE
ncbi:MAG: hypothetical protein JXR73_10750 [Candidatus Omnitrophica bacterium]|nr:hypothetical protein [Candidatus Omnitrophota bacterium]